MKYDRDYFIKKFKAIPEDKWIVGDYFNEKINACCALGHCGARRGAPTLEGESLNYLLDHDTVHINDGYSRQAKGDTPKQRILNALKAIK